MTESVRVLPMPAVEHIRAKPGMYLPAGSLCLEAKLAMLLASDALALGADDVHIVQRDGWWAVCSGADWLLADSPQDPQQSFERLIALPQAGQNCIRHEVVINAFAASVLTSIGGRVVVVRSDAGDDIAIGAALCNAQAAKRVVAFRCSRAS